ncbi:hypothetical protein J6590_102864 [Homalodisca vitripennis]|nr:hypothetical protein J6590_102864 [Homalodisca vitripennis]
MTEEVRELRRAVLCVCSPCSVHGVGVCVRPRYAVFSVCVTCHVIQCTRVMSTVYIVYAYGIYPMCVSEPVFHSDPKQVVGVSSLLRHCGFLSQIPRLPFSSANRLPLFSSTVERNL